MPRAPGGCGSGFCLLGQFSCESPLRWNLPHPVTEAPPGHARVSRVSWSESCLPGSGGASSGPPPTHEAAMAKSRVVATVSVGQVFFLSFNP